MWDFKHYPPKGDSLSYWHHFSFGIHRDDYQDLKRWCVDHGMEVIINIYINDDLYMKAIAKSRDVALLFKLTWA